MSDFLISLLDLCFIPFRSIDNLIVFIPVSCLVVVFLFVIFYRLFRLGGSL